MMHDPFQAYSNFGSYGIPTPIGLQYPSLQASALNPVAALNPLLGLSPQAQAGGVQQMGQPQYIPNVPNVGQGFINPQQAQLVTLLASLLSNPLIAASLQAQALGPYGGGHQHGFQPQQFYPQIGQYPQQLGQVGYPLAPQSWIGQGGVFGNGQGFGQVHPLQAQMTPRPFQAQGFSPWGY